MVQKKFGKQAYALMKKTILAPDSEIEFDFKTYNEISAVGLISSIKCPCHRWGGLPQGKVIANLFLKTEDGMEMIYDVKAGEDTSDTYREAVSSSHRAHQKTLVFRSWQVSWFKPEFEAFDYYTIYSLPSPVKLKSLRIKCLKSGCLFCISDIVLIPSGDN